MVEPASLSNGHAETARYQRPDSTQTLAQGLAEYRARNPHLFDPDELATRPGIGSLARFFAAHDACHVLFGLDTSVGDESLADTWTLFGTDATWAELRGYFASREQRALLADLVRSIGWGSMIVQALRAIPRVVRAIAASRRMTSKWRLHRWAEHLDRPLLELRREHGIELV